MSTPSLFSKTARIPKEQLLEVSKNKGVSLKIGIPKENTLNEHRIGLTPDAVSVLSANGHLVVVESNAGLGAHYSDHQYSEAGARIVYDHNTPFEQDIVLKVLPPSLEELAFVKPNAVLISSLIPYAQNIEYFALLEKKRITALAFEYIKDEYGELGVMKILSEIAGTTAVLVAAELLSTSHGGSGLLMGGVAGVRPTEVVIIGAGTAGEYAAKSALGLGATVKVFDYSSHRLRAIQDHVGQRISTSFIEPKELSKSLMRCDVAIGALYHQGRMPNVVSEAMVTRMKSGSVVVDLSINHGGCFETSEMTTHENPTVIKHNVYHYGVPNITSRVSRTTSKALGNYFLRYLLSMCDNQNIEHLLQHNAGLRKGVYVYKGRLTNQPLSKWFDLPYHDIDLLII